jgi:putative oxidoreductase
MLAFLGTPGKPGKTAAENGVSFSLGAATCKHLAQLLLILPGNQCSNAERSAMLSNTCKSVLSPLLLRLMLAAIFVFHGLALVGGEGNDMGASWASKMPDPPPPPVQMAVAWGELIGGAALGVGLLTRLAALGIIAIMAGAIATVHWQNGFDITKGGFEYNAAVITMCVCLVLGGPGSIAVDHWFHLRRRQS